MLAAEHGTVSDIEIVWVVLALVGVVFTLLNLGEAKSDLKWVNRAGISNGRRVLAQTGLWMEVCRFVIQAIFCVIGVLAMLVHDAPSSIPAAQEAIRVAITWGLIISSALLTFKTYLARRVRKELARPRDVLPSEER